MKVTKKILTGALILFVALSSMLQADEKKAEEAVCKDGVCTLKKRDLKEARSRIHERRRARTAGASERQRLRKEMLKARREARLKVARQKRELALKKKQNAEVVEKNEEAQRVSA